MANTFKSEQQIGIGSETIEKYIGYFEESFLIEKAVRYDVKGRKYIRTPAKYYYTDLGLRNARLGFRQLEETHIMENILYNDLIRRGMNVDVGVVEYNTKDADGKKMRRIGGATDQILTLPCWAAALVQCGSLFAFHSKKSAFHAFVIMICERNPIVYI